jgi:hypothetical protein
MAPKPRLGEILIYMGTLTKQQLEGALSHQRQWGVSLGRALVAKGFCTEAQVLQALSKQTGIPPMNLDTEQIGSLMRDLIPQKFAEEHHVVPVRTSGARGEVLVVAMGAPAGMATQDQVKAISGKSRLEVYVASDEAIQRAIGRIYRGDSGVFLGEGAVDSRERTLDFDDKPASEFEVEHGRILGDEGSDPLAPFALSRAVREIISRAAKSKGITREQVVAKILEGWASKYLTPK